MVMTPGLAWEAKEVNDALIANLKGAYDAFSADGFMTVIANRHESPKSDLTKMMPKIKGPQDVLMGAPSIDSFSFYKNSEDFQGSFVFYKDRMYFAASLAYKFDKPALAIMPEEKKAQIDGLLNDLKTRTVGAGLTLSGSVDSFAIGASGSFTRESAAEFLGKVKGALSGLKLRAL